MASKAFLEGFKEAFRGDHSKDADISTEKQKRVRRKGKKSKTMFSTTLSDMALPMKRRKLS